MLLPSAQGVVRPQSVVTLVGLALSPLYSWLLIFKLGLRLDGAALAVDATQVGAGLASCHAWLACSCVLFVGAYAAGAA